MSPALESSQSGSAAWSGRGKAVDAPWFADDANEKEIIRVDLEGQGMRNGLAWRGIMENPKGKGDIHWFLYISFIWLSE